MIKFFIFFFLPLNILANVYTPSEEELDPEAKDILIRKPEKYLRHESMIYDFNPDLGIKDHRLYTGKDKNRFSLAGHLYGNYEQLSNLLGLEVVYMRRSSRFDNIWYGAQVFQHNTIFGAITQNQTSGSTPNSEASFQRPEEADNSVFGLGVGVGYRFKLLLDFFETEDVFETVDVFFNSIQMSEAFIDEEYRGWGLTTNYSIHKRSGTSYFYGGKISYNVASVTRQALGTESRSDRSLSLGWPSFAAEIGFFF